MPSYTHDRCRPTSLAELDHHISKFRTKPFPLYDKLGDLYDGHIAEGNYNFTSIEATQVSDGDPKVERGAPGGSDKKPVKEHKKKCDPMVEMMAQYVEIKQKQAEESTLLAGSENAQGFSISKCIPVLHKKSIPRAQRAAAIRYSKLLRIVRFSSTPPPKMKRAPRCSFRARWQSCLEGPDLAEDV